MFLYYTDESWIWRVILIPDLYPIFQLWTQRRMYYHLRDDLRGSSRIWSPHLRLYSRTLWLQTKERMQDSKNYFTVSLSLCLSVFLSLCLSVFLSFCLSVFLSFYFSVFFIFEVLDCLEWRAKQLAWCCILFFHFFGFFIFYFFCCLIPFFYKFNSLSKKMSSNY